MKLQLALDGTLEDGLQALRSAQPWVDVVEAGTPLLLREGVWALRRLRAELSDTPLMADFKIMDAGDLEARIAFAAGADQVTVLGVADDATIASALAAARDCGGEILVDLMAVPHPLQRVMELLPLGCERFCVHRGHDGCGDPVAPLRELRAALPELHLAVAGGIDEHTIEALTPYCPDTVIVGSAITGAAQPGLAARRIMETIRAHV